jgi:hypothetical protein
VNDKETIERLRVALKRLVADSRYADHPEASQLAIDALGGVGWLYGEVVPQENKSASMLN